MLEESRRQQGLEEGDFFDDEAEMEDDFEKGNGPKRFRYGELAIATESFSDERKLGEGGFGLVYRGFLKEPGLDVAIKRSDAVRGAQGRQAQQRDAGRGLQRQARRLRARQIGRPRPGLGLAHDRARRDDGVHGPRVHDHRHRLRRL
jgi:hypothetical protein